MDKTNKVGIKNIANHNVGITVEDLRLHRVLNPGQTIFLGKDILEEALTYPGVMFLFTNKYLVIDDTNFALDQGVLTEEDVEETKDNSVIQKNIQDEEAIKKIINSGTELELKKLISDETPARQQIIADIAATCEGLTLGKMDIIKRITGIDLTKVIH